MIKFSLLEFLDAFKYYLLEIIPALILGFFLSGVIHEFISVKWINKHLGDRSIKGILYATFIGTLVPVCCWGSLPIAISFYMRGASLGPVLALLIATPATSINALIVTGEFLGLKFAFYLFFSVIFMGIGIGIIGNFLKIRPRFRRSDFCPQCNENENEEHSHFPKSLLERIKSVLKFAYLDMPREIGLETLLGLMLAALVSVIAPIGILMKNYLAGNRGYLFSLVLGLIMYMCSTMSVPLVDAFLKQGLSNGAGLVLLLIGPITSYGTILVLRKEFGIKLLLIYLALICSVSLLLGYVFALL